MEGPTDVPAEPVPRVAALVSARPAWCAVCGFRPNQAEGTAAGSPQLRDGDACPAGAAGLGDLPGRA